jgi:midasin
MTNLIRPLGSILSALLRNPLFANGPLGLLLACERVELVETPRLHHLLLAYYRILQANRELPGFLLWPLLPLSNLFRTHPDTGVRLLAIRCYALQSDMGEAEKENLETEVLGERFGVDCDLEYGLRDDGSVHVVDGWTMPMTEVQRVTEARNSMIRPGHDYYSAEEGDTARTIHPSELR